VTLGSFSKTVLGRAADRMGARPRGIIARLAARQGRRRPWPRRPSSRAIVAALIRSAHEEIIAYRADWARQRYTAVAAALTAFLPDWTWTPPAGGLTLWARRPGDADSGGFAQAALRLGASRVVPGRLLSVSAERSPWLRLAFTLSPDDLATAVKGLASVLTSHPFF